MTAFPEIPGAPGFHDILAAAARIAPHARVTPVLRSRSLDAIADQLKTKEPRALPILARYGFTPKEFVTAFMAVANTEFAAAMLEHPDSPFAKGIKKDHGYNDKNVAFFQAHRAQITAAMKKINDDSACGR